MEEQFAARAVRWLFIDGGIHLPKYFFHIRRNDVFEEDPEGIDLASPELAFEEATAAAREIVAERIRMAIGQTETLSRL
ncbi:DUF6894 family protein [Rhizobium laguerreae]|uniref:DUF6894 family protein n=1 Tax=Rhizobium laguerreae TaxID=1076926 RepID=UPI0035E432C2